MTTYFFCITVQRYVITRAAMMGQRNIDVALPRQISAQLFADGCRKLADFSGLPVALKFDVHAKVVRILFGAETHAHRLTKPVRTQILTGQISIVVTEAP